MTATKKIDELILNELAAMNRKHSDTNAAVFNTPHEAYAVTAEEIDEAAECMSGVFSVQKELWDCVKTDDTAGIVSRFIRIEKCAIAGIQELIQVAACCEKTRGSFGKGGAND